MNQKKAKELRKMDDQAVELIYEVSIKIYSNGQTAVAANNNQAIDDPILFNSIMTDCNKAVLKRWNENRQRAMKFAEEAKSKIVTLN